MFYSKYIWIVAILLLNHAGYPQNVSSKIDEIIAKTLPHATIGVLIRDAQNGSVVYSRNADKLMSPASSMKLFTAAAALYHLKPEYRFATSLSQKNQNYYLTFTGSPSFTEQNLNDLLSYLHGINNQSIKGNIVIDISQYQAPDYPSGTSYDDLGWYYAAPDTALILNENSARYDLISAKELGKKAQIKPKSTLNELNLINEVITVSKEEEKDHCSLNLEIRSANTIRLFGCVIQDKNPKLLELAIPDPIVFAKQRIKSFLDKNGIQLEGNIITGQTPPDAQLIARFHSPSLTDLVKHMLQESDNLYANSLSKKLGYSLTGRGTHKEGAFAIKKIVSEHAHLDLSQTSLIDGEGTRYNLVTAEQIVQLLNALYHDNELQPILLRSLPQAGVSGTLKDRMKKVFLEKKVYAKTGSMHDISSLSGILVNPNGKSYIFSIIINGINKPLGEAKSLEEKILLAVDEDSLEDKKIE